MGHVPAPPSEPGSDPDGGGLTSRELDDLRRFAVMVAARAGASFDDAQDIAQRVLLDVWRKSPAITEYRAWVLVASQREVWRLVRNRERPLPLDGLAFIAADSMQANDKSIDDFVERDQILGWISGLPPEQAAVIALSMDGLSPSEIAGCLQIPPSLARVRLRSAREKLRAAFVAQMAADRRAERRSVTRPRRPVTQQPTANPVPREEKDLAALPPRQQEVLRLSRRGYKPAQIARVLAISPNTVRVNLFHARKRIRQAVGTA